MSQNFYNARVSIWLRAMIFSISAGIACSSLAVAGPTTTTTYTTCADPKHPPSSSCNKTSGGSCARPLVNWSCPGSDPENTYGASSDVIPKDSKTAGTSVPNVVGVYPDGNTSGLPTSYAAPCPGNPSQYCTITNKKGDKLTDQSKLTGANKPGGVQIDAPSAAPAAPTASTDPAKGGGTSKDNFAPTGDTPQGVLSGTPMNAAQGGCSPQNGGVMMCPGSSGADDKHYYGIAANAPAGQGCNANDITGCHEMRNVDSLKPMTQDQFAKSSINGGTGSGVANLSSTGGAPGTPTPTATTLTSADNVGGDGGMARSVSTGVGDKETTETRFKDGGSVSTNGIGDAAQTDVTLGKRDDSEKFNRADVSDGGDTDCKVSAGVNSKYGCKGTRLAIETAKVSNVLGQTMGSVATSALGQAAQQKAAAEGTQSSALHAAASTERTSGELQVGAGAVNVVMGIVQMAGKASHDGTASDFLDAKKKAGSLDGKVGTKDTGQTEGQQGYLSSKNETVNNIINNTSGDMNAKSRGLVNVQGANAAGECPPPNPSNQASVAAWQKCTNALEYRKKQFADKRNTMAGDIKGIANLAAGEQAQMAQQAMAGGMMSIITGASQAVAGGFAIAAANQLDQAADNLAAVENTAPPVAAFAPLGASNMSNGDATAGGNGNSLNPSTAAPTPAAASSDKTPADLGNLGTPLGTPQGNTPTGGPAPGAFQAGQPGGGSGSGGGLGGVGGASTAPASADNSDPQAKMADSGRGAGYDGGSGVMSGGGGGGAGADKGPDLSGLLAQFLPKKDEEKNGNGILDFGGRNPASEGPVSLLDRNVNIFDRIHDTYQDKNRRGRVGL